MMLTLYLVALALGGTFVVASLLLGGKGDSHVDHGADAGGHAPGDAGDAHHGADKDVSGDLALVWLPVTSLRFWTFFLAFFGLTGTVLTVLEVLPSATVTGIIAGVIGYASGWGVVAVIRAFSKNQIDSSVSERDYIGATARVMVPVGPEKLGKVRVELKGRTVELLARTEDPAVIEPSRSVMIYGMTDEGHALVTRSMS